MTNDKWLSCLCSWHRRFSFFYLILRKEYWACQAISQYFKPSFTTILFFVFLFPLYTVINCTPLVPPSNGMISPSSCLSRSSYGQSCRISCQRQGYSLEGGSVRMCSSDGEWTGSNDTICKGEDNSVLLLIVACWSNFGFSNLICVYLKLPK